MNPIDVKRRQIEICSHVLGMISLLLFGSVLGDNGVAYVAAAMECFLLFWALTGSAVADVLGRILRGRSARGQYRNVAKMRRSALLLEGIAGLLGSVLMFVFAGQIARNILRVPYSTAMIMLLAPAILLRTLSSVLLAYFQGDGTELPAVISVIARQIGILGFGLLFANLFQGYGSKVSILLKQENFTAMYSGMGIALAVPVTEAIILLFLFLVYRGSRGRSQTNSEGMRATDSFGSQLRVLYGNLFPAVLAEALRVLPLLLGILFYRKVSGTDIDMEKYGVFYGKYLALCFILILPAHALLLSACSNAAASLRREEQRFARNHFWGGLHVGMVYSLFWITILWVLTPQVAGTFCKTNLSAAEEMLRSGAVLILFVVLGRYFIELLRQMRGKYLVLGILAIHNIVFTVSVTLMLNGGKQGIMALVYAGILAEGVAMLLAGALVCYQIRCGIDLLQGLAIPLGTACVTGLILLFLGKVLTPHLGNIVTVIVCALVAAVVYLVILTLLRNFRGQDMGYIPGSDLFRKLGRLFRQR